MLWLNGIIRSRAWNNYGNPWNLHHTLSISWISSCVVPVLTSWLHYYNVSSLSLVGLGFQCQITLKLSCMIQAAPFWSDFAWGLYFLCTLKGEHLNALKEETSAGDFMFLLGKNSLDFMFLPFLCAIKVNMFLTLWGLENKILKILFHSGINY